MEILLKALEFIWKLVPHLKGLTGQRRKDYFEKILKPLFDSVGTVHECYLEMILSARRGVLDIKIHNTPFIGTEVHMTSEALVALEEVKKAFLDARMQDEGLRDYLRNNAQESFKLVDWKEERRFLASVMYYFLGKNALHPTPEEIDRDVGRVLEKGGVSCWDTPSIRLYLEIRDCKDPGEILVLLDDARHSLNQRYMNVRLSFSKVEHELVLHG